MKTIYSILACLFIASNSIAQDCKVEDDPFTGAKTVTYDFKRKSVYYNLVDGKARMEIKFNYSGEFNKAIQPGAQIILKTVNEEVITITTDRVADPVSSVSQYGVMTQFIYSASIDKSTLEKLAGVTFTIMRHPDAKGGFTDIEFKGGTKKWGKSISTGAQCILENL